jgi:hypothetical protein
VQVSRGKRQTTLPNAWWCAGIRRSARQQERDEAWALYSRSYRGTPKNEGFPAPSAPAASSDRVIAGGTPIAEPSATTCVAALFLLPLSQPDTGATPFLSMKLTPERLSCERHYVADVSRVREERALPAQITPPAAGGGGGDAGRTNAGVGPGYLRAIQCDVPEFDQPCSTRSDAKSIHSRHSPGARLARHFASAIARLAFSSEVISAFGKIEHLLVTAHDVDYLLSTERNLRGRAGPSWAAAGASTRGRGVNRELIGRRRFAHMPACWFGPHCCPGC